MDEETSIPIKVDGLTIAVVNKDGTVNLGNIDGKSLYEAVSRYHDLAKVDPAIFMLLSAVVTQAAAIRNLSLEVEALKAKLAS